MAEARERMGNSGSGGSDSGASSNKKKAKHPLKPVCEMDPKERRAAYGRLTTALRSESCPEFVKAYYEKITALADRPSRETGLTEFLSLWVEGAMLEAFPKPNTCLGKFV